MPRPHRGPAIMAVCALSATALIAVPLTASAAPAPAGVVLNEIVYDDGPTGLADQVELYNAGDEPVALDGWKISDDKRDRFGSIPADTVLEPGGFLMLVNGVDFDFGLGKRDEVVLYDPAGAVIDQHAYDNTAPLATWARCPDGTGAWAPATAVTPGAANDCSIAPVAGSILINEVDSQPADWVEFHNPGTESLDISGYEIRDDSDDHRWQFRPGSAIEPGAFLVVDEASIGIVDGVEAAFRDPIGIGSADRIRLFDRDGTMIDDTLAWNGHAAIDGDFAAATLARCPDGRGAFVLAHATPAAANSCVLPDVAINEIESNGDATDWVEIVNTGATPVDISGWSVMDDDPIGHAGQSTPLPVGSILEPGAHFVFDQPRDFVFGLGGGDTVTLRDAEGTTIDEHVYTVHAKGVWARCADGSGDFADIAVSTKGIRNACGNPVRLNEVESDAGSPDDWIELANPTSAALDVSGLIVKDDDDAHTYRIPAGTTIAAGGYLVIERDELGFGLGGGDRVRLFDGELLIDETSWGPGHAATTWGRCPDVTGVFATTAEATKGAANVCAGEVPVSPWPGSQDVRVLDSVPTFLADSSGLDVQETSEGAVLWGIDNGEGRLWKLRVSADGSFAQIPGWEQGKRIRFQKDADDPAAAGPDTEGVTVDGEGFVYAAAERDNSIKGVNRNVVLKVDPRAAGDDLVAVREWDLTGLLPAVGANLGIEAVEWIPDEALAGALFDQSTGAAYRPADHPGHGTGLFFVAMEDNGHVYAFALGDDGSAKQVAEIAPGLAGVMGLDYDPVLDVLWAVCDNGCQGRSAQIGLNGTDKPGIAHFARPTGLPDINNEGFATGPASLSQDGVRPVWWFADGATSESLHTGTLPAAEQPEQPGGTDPLPGTDLNDGNRGDVRVDPAVAAPGQRVTVTVGDDLDGADVAVWLYSTPQRIGSGQIGAGGSIDVVIPADAKLGAHRVAVYTASGELVGWADLRVVADAQPGGVDGGPLATTGSAAPVGAVLLGILMVLAGVLITARRRAA